MIESVKKAFWETKRDRTVSIVILSLIGALILFKLGMFVGYHKALFSYRSDDRHFTVSMAKGDGVFGVSGVPVPGFREEFSTSHGAVGRVVSVSLPSFVVATPDNFERTVMIGDRTMIRRAQKTVSADNIKSDDFTVVLGDPDDSGRIKAKFIRIVPEGAAGAGAGFVTGGTTYTAGVPAGNVIYSVSGTSTR